MVEDKSGYSDRLTAMSEEARFREMWGISTYQAKKLRIPEEHREEIISEVAYHLQMRAWDQYDETRGITLAGWLHYVARRRMITEFRKYLRKTREVYEPHEVWVTFEQVIAAREPEDQDVSWGTLEHLRSRFHPFEQWVLEHLSLQPNGLKLREPLMTWFLIYGVSALKVNDVRDRLWRVIHKGHVDRLPGRTHDLDVEWRRLKRKFRDLRNNEEQERARRIDGHEEK